jgi:hypothetical protein
MWCSWMILKGENGGAATVNYSGFANWSVVNGSVDLIGNGFQDPYPGNGLYVDLDGTTQQSATLESTAGIAAAPGEYLFEFDLGDTNFLPGSPAEANELSVSVLDGDLNVLATGPYSSSDTLDGVFTLQSLSFDVASATDLTVRFVHESVGDNFGLAIDNVRITLVPEPGALSIAMISVVIFHFRRSRC